MNLLYNLNLDWRKINMVSLEDAMGGVLITLGCLLVISFFAVSFFITAHEQMEENKQLINTAIKHNIGAYYIVDEKRVFKYHVDVVGGKK